MNLWGSSRFDHLPIRFYRYPDSVRPPSTLFWAISPTHTFINTKLQFFHTNESSDACRSAAIIVKWKRDAIRNNFTRHTHTQKYREREKNTHVNSINGQTTHRTTVITSVLSAVTPLHVSCPGWTPSKNHLWPLIIPWTIFFLSSREVFWVLLLFTGRHTLVGPFDLDTAWFHFYLLRSYLAVVVDDHTGIFISYWTKVFFFSITNVLTHTTTV